MGKNIIFFKYCVLTTLKCILWRINTLKFKYLLCILPRKHEPGGVECKKKQERKEKKGNRWIRKCGSCGKEILSANLMRHIKEKHQKQECNLNFNFTKTLYQNSADISVREVWSLYLISGKYMKIYLTFNFF